jgi:quinol monooxygenase YgiN
MLIIAGRAEVDPDELEEAVAVMRDPVTRARDAPGRLDLAITTDSIDPTRINNFERWESQEALDTARSNGPGFE